MTDDQFIEALYQCDFPKGDLDRPAIDFYRAMLNRLLGVSLHPPTIQDLYDMLEAGFAEVVPDHDKLMKEWVAIGPNLSADAGDFGVFLVRQIEWEEAEGKKVRAEIDAMMGIAGPGLPANVEPAAILSCYAAMCKDHAVDEEDESEEGGSVDEEDDSAAWTDLVDVFYYGSRYE